MLKRFYLYVELDYTARKNARLNLEDMMREFVDDVINGIIPRGVLVKYLCSESKMDSLVLDFIFDDHGNQLMPRAELKRNEVESGYVSIVEEELSDLSQRS